MERIKEFFANLFRDPAEEALSDQWNDFIKEMNKKAKEREAEYNKKEDEICLMNDSDLLKEIAKNTLHIKKLLETM